MTHYEILGVKQNASQEEIRSAYKTLIKKYHPDLYQGDKSFADKKTKEINEAYDVLSDYTKRTEYNLEINPTSYDNTSSYSYTPPKYDYTPPKYNYNNNSYTNYDNRYSTKNSSEYSDYQKRYTDYHRSKTPNSDYSSKNDFFYNKYNSVSNRLLLNIFLVLGIFIIYIIIFTSSIVQYNSYKNGETSGTILHQEKKNDNLENTYTNTYVEEDYNEEDEFNINDYFSDSDLRQIYYEYYTDDFESFSNFKKAFSSYLEEYYSF